MPSVETALLVTCSAKVLMIADGVCLNLLFMFPEQKHVADWEPAICNECCYAQTAPLLSAVSTAGIKGFLFSLCRIQKKI